MPKPSTLKKSCMGAIVRYCGHEGYFLADIYLVGNAATVVACGPVTPQNIARPGPEVLRQDCTHHLLDFPKAGCWKPERGFFTVPASQVRELTREVV
jgi:hypothetical protein